MKKIILLFLLSIILTFCVNAQEPLKAYAGENRHFCFESDWISVTLGGNPTASGGIPPYTYRWWANDVVVYFMDNGETAANPDVTFLGSFTAYVEVKDATDNIDVDSVVITMSKQQLTFSNDPQYLQIDYYINSGDSVFLSGNVKVLNQSSSFSWSPCESIVNNCLVADGFWAKPTTTTDYYLTAKDEHNCSETFFTHFYRVIVDEVGIESDISEYTITIYPNPTSQIINIEIPDDFRGIKSNVEIFDVTGNKVYNQSFRLFDIQIDISDLKCGVYLFVFFSAGKRVTKYFIKQ